MHRKKPQILFPPKYSRASEMNHCLGVQTYGDRNTDLFKAQELAAMYALKLRVGASYHQFGNSITGHTTKAQL